METPLKEHELSIGTTRPGLAETVSAVAECPGLSHAVRALMSKHLLLQVQRRQAPFLASFTSGWGWERPRVSGVGTPASGAVSVSWLSGKLGPCLEGGSVWLPV